ncbi:MAG: ABC transporter permease, partial [Verrucomicrobiota bacterium]
MNPLVKKEIRLLLPGFIIGAALTFASWLLFDRRFETDWNWVPLFVSLVACPAMAGFMALNSFGAEISAGTFSMLLSQPVSRLKIWQTKISLLAVALLVFGVLWFSPFFCLRNFPSNRSDNFNDLFNLFSCVVMFALVVFSGALWTVLLMRQVAAAFWFTLIVPGAIMAISIGLFSDKSDEFITGIVVSALGIYGLGGFFYARWLFLRAQDAAWTGGTIALPEMRGLAWMKTRSGTGRLWRPRAALLAKEFQLHQSQFVLAGALLVLHLGILALKKFSHIKHNSAMELVVEIFWGLWLVLPMLVGAAAVAEERKLGTLESHLCLPVKKRTQFATKCLVVLLLSALF